MGILLKKGVVRLLADNEIQLGAKIELAKRDFFEYCHLKAPDFYKYDREYLIEMADDLQNFLDSDDDVLVINEPP